MKSVRQRTTRLALAAALAGCVGGVGGADEKAVASPAAELPADAIAIARREFDAVKSSRNSGVQPKGELPRLTVPELRSTPAPAAPWTPQKATVPEKRSANWLVDAMEKSADARKDRERTGADRERDQGRSRELLGPEKEKDDADAVEPRRASDSTAERERKTENAVANPLAGYLGVWMTPQDYALLKPGIDQAFGNAAGTSGPGAAPLPDAAAVFSLPGSDGIGGSNIGAARSTPAAPRENPYLAMLNPPAPTSASAAAIASAPPPMSVAPGRAMPPPPAPIPAVKSPIPDFAKPAADEKYFKQLKRF